MFAGIPDMCALDAWFDSALDIEEAICFEEHLTGGAADIYKCFDQVIPELAQYLLMRAGMPHRILGAYMDFHKELQIRNSLAGTLGEPYKRKCSVPQGCPFSMMIIALVMRPWTIIVAKEGCKPRILADDMEMHAIGPGHAQKFHKAYGKSIEYLVDMGAKIAHDKCFLFSTSPDARVWLTNVIWPILNKPIKVVLDAEIWERT